MVKDQLDIKERPKKLNMQEFENKLFQGWTSIRTLAKDKSISKEKSFELNELENEIYNKWLFVKELAKAIRKEKKDARIFKK